ncbi:MAG: ABC transporter ATP-binding protein/permease [Firmicutes bacterium]|nr:ABC transporter ATP-binding protein/permease [Bacillota bacterium]
MLELRNVSKVYHNTGGINVTALRAVNLSLGKCGLVFVVGQSGSGKTTLLNILSAIDTPTGGDVFVNGVNIRQLGSGGLDGYRNNYIGVVHQDGALLGHLTLFQNVALALRIQGREINKKQIDALFKRLGIDGLQCRYPSEVSGGQAQRVAIARVLVRKPRILFADELTSSLDFERRDEIYGLLKMLSKDYLVVSTTHSREMMEKYADRVVTISNGLIEDDVRFVNGKKIQNDGKVVALASDYGTFTYEKTALPFASAFGLAWSSFSANKLRTSFTILLSMLAISFFAIVVNLSFVTQNSAVINSFARSGHPYIVFSNDSQLFDQAIINPLVRQGYRGVATLHEIGSSPVVNFELGGVTHSMFGVRRLGMYESVGVGANIFGQDLIVGRWPRSGDTTNQIVVSDFIATQIMTAYFAQNGFIPDNFFEYIVGYNSLTGVVSGRAFEFDDGNYRFTIIGVYRTTFAGYFEFEEAGLFRPFERNFAGTDTGVFNHRMLGFRNGLSEVQRSRAMYLVQNDWVTAFTHSSVLARIRGGLGQSAVHRSIDWFGMNMRQMIIGGQYGSQAESFFITDHPQGARPQNESQLANAPLFRIAQEDGLRIVRNHDTTISPISQGTARISRRLYNLLANGGFAPPRLEFHVTRSISNFTDIYDDLISDLFMSENRQQVVRYIPLREFSFSGINSNANVIEDEDEYIIMLGNEDFELLVNTIVIPSTSMIISGRYSAGSIIDMFDAMPYRTIARFADSDTIAEFMDGFGVTRIAMLITAVVVGVFAIVFMYGFITIGLASKRRNISILRSMGARTRDIIKIFMIEAIIISSIILIGSIAFTLAGMASGNLAVQRITGNSLLLFTSGALFWIAVLGTAFAIIMASYLLPALRFAKRNRKSGVIGGMKGRNE